jgi:hypothetical protein
VLDKEKIKLEIYQTMALPTWTRNTGNYGQEGMKRQNKLDKIKLC